MADRHRGRGPLNMSLLSRCRCLPESGLMHPRGQPPLQVLHQLSSLQAHQLHPQSNLTRSPMVQQYLHMRGLVMVTPFY